MPRAAPLDAPPRLADRMRDATRDLHATAESTGIVADLLAGRASVRGYGLLLANLRPAYAALEYALDSHRAHAALAPLAQPAVYRTHALATALGALGLEATQPLPIAQAYAARIAIDDERTPARLVAHAYARYLGDLAGGAVLARQVRAALGVHGDAAAFHAFPALPDPRGFARRYRAWIDASEAALGPLATVAIDEARSAFEINIALSIAVREALGA